MAGQCGAAESYYERGFETDHLPGYDYPLERVIIKPVEVKWIEDYGDQAVQNRFIRVMNRAFFDCRLVEVCVDFTEMMWTISSACSMMLMGDEFVFGMANALGDFAPFMAKSFGGKYGDECLTERDVDKMEVIAEKSQYHGLMYIYLEETLDSMEGVNEKPWRSPNEEEHCYDAIQQGVDKALDMLDMVMQRYMDEEKEEELEMCMSDDDFTLKCHDDSAGIAAIVGRAISAYEGTTTYATVEPEQSGVSKTVTIVELPDKKRVVTLEPEPDGVRPGCGLQDEHEGAMSVRERGIVYDQMLHMWPPNRDKEKLKKEGRWDNTRKDYIRGDECRGMFTNGRSEQPDDDYGRVTERGKKMRKRSRAFNDRWHYTKK